MNHVDHFPCEARKVSRIRVCVLAYNEQKHIARTIDAIVTGNQDQEFDVVVYANGCTDNTVEIVQKLCRITPRLQLRELKKPSKVNTWNTAFRENHQYDFLFFADGDVRPEPGSLRKILIHFAKCPQASLVCAQYWPDYRGLSWEKRMTGFLQIPLAQDYLSGQFYAIRRHHLADRFSTLQLDGIPEGIAVEDDFLHRLVPRNAFVVASTFVFYEPPTVADYCRYLARLRWQEEQFIQVYRKILFQSEHSTKCDWVARIRQKLSHKQSLGRTLLGIASSGSRTLLKFGLHRRVNRCYHALGPIRKDGDRILTQATRSDSTK